MYCRKVLLPFELVRIVRYIALSGDGGEPQSRQKGGDTTKHLGKSQESGCFRLYSNSAGDQFFRELPSKKMDAEAKGRVGTLRRIIASCGPAWAGCSGYLCQSTAGEDQWRNAVDGVLAGLLTKF